MSGEEKVDTTEEMLKALDWQKSSEEIGYWYKNLGTETVTANDAREAWDKELAMT